jgi:hypothetical protein
LTLSSKSWIIAPKLKDNGALCCGGLGGTLGIGGSIELDSGLYGGKNGLAAYARLLLAKGLPPGIDYAGAKGFMLAFYLLICKPESYSSGISEG